MAEEALAVIRIIPLEDEPGLGALTLPGMPSRLAIQP